MPLGAPGMALPKSPAGGPTGPGASPSLSPGGGAGMQAAAEADIGTVLQTLVKLQTSFPALSKQGTALRRAIDALKIFGGGEAQALQPAAQTRMAQMAKAGQGLGGHNMPMPSMMLGGPGKMAQPPAGPGAGPPGMGGM